MIKMNEYLEKVKEFHETFGLKVSNNPNEITREDMVLRISLLVEELDEMKESLYEMDATKNGDAKHNWKKTLLDALLDLQYVLSGAVLTLGFTKIFDKAFIAVHESNMTKALDTVEEAEKEVGKYITNGVDCHFVERNDKFVIVRSSDGKILKPSGYSPVSLSRFLSKTSDNS